jgi:hypothetical protein
VILDKAHEDLRIWPVVLMDDGYRGQRPGKAIQLPDGTYDPPEGAPISLKGFVMPTGFAGAGWAANQRYGDQGWATVARATFVVKYRPGLLMRWARIEAQGFEWTVVDSPRFYSSRRIKYLTAMAEVRGDANG